tara:strand:+ start:1119 stop:1256 length:138 start_codon:yes stop_codon:yes gene_type:complete
MILEKKVVDILQEEMPRVERNVKWDGMYNHIAKRIVNTIKESIFE